MKKNLLFLILLLTGFTVFKGEGQTIYVDSAATGTGDGSSWANAYPYLSDALSAASADNSVTDILIAKGTYYPTGTQSSTDRIATFYITRSGIHIKGGYPTGGGDQPIPPSLDQGTILSGNIGDPAINTDNSYHVFCIVNISGSDGLVLEGLQFSDGQSNNGDITTPINSKVIDGNTGGGVYYQSQSGPVDIHNCIFTRNAASYLGGALAIGNQKTPILISNCLFYNNVSEYGSAILNFGALTVKGTTFFGNTNTVIDNNFTANLTISNSIMWDNAIEISSFLNQQIDIIANNCIINNFDPAMIDEFSSASYISTEDPLFEEPDNGNFQLHTNSPAINAGNNDLLPNALEIDLAGNPRIVDSRTDLGAFEHQVFSNTITNNQGSTYIGMEGTLDISGSELSAGVWPVSYEWVLEINGNTDTESIDTILIASPSDFPSEILAGFGIQLDSAHVKIDDLSKLPLLLSLISDGETADELASFQGTINFTRLATAGGSPDVSNQITVTFNSVATPVTIYDFKGNLQGNRAFFSWKSGIEQGFSHFELESSTGTQTGKSNQHWKLVDSVPAQGSGSSYSTTINHSAPTVYYRLKAVDKDGKVSFADKIIGLGQQTKTFLSVYPNPATDKIFLNTTEPVDLVIYDQLGRQVLGGAHKLKAGLNVIGVSSLGAGIYYGKLSTGKGFSFIKK